MEQCMQNCLISDLICKLLDFETLKVLRLVNKICNTSANFILRKRCKPIRLDLQPSNAHFEEYLQWERSLADGGLTAGIPIDASIEQNPEENAQQSYLWTMMRDYSQDAPAPAWRENVVSLRVELPVDEPQDENLAAFLLHSFPNLAKLELKYSSSVPRRDQASFEILQGYLMPPNAKFPTLLNVEFSSTSIMDNTFDFAPAFLGQCPSLKRISLQCFGPPALNFFKRWEEMYLEDLPSLRLFKEIQLQIDDDNMSSTKTSKLLTAMANFIDRNEPTTLKLYGDPKQSITVISKLQASTRDKLTKISVAFQGETMLLDQVLKLPPFQNSMEIRVDTKTLCVGRMEAVNQQPRIVSLQIVGTTEYPDGLKLLRKFAHKFAPHLQCVTRVKLQMPTIDSSLTNPRRNLLFQFRFYLAACRNFPNLRHLAVDVNIWGKPRLCCTEVLERLGGYFKWLANFRDLTSFKVHVRHDGKLSEEVILAALFYGCEPHVDMVLEFTSMPVTSGGAKRNVYRRTEASVEEMRRILANANEVLRQETSMGQLRCNH